MYVSTIPNYDFELSHRFDELRLLPGTLTLASGIANILFTLDGRWTVETILLDSDDPAQPRVPVSHNLHMVRLIRDALQIEDADCIAQKVQDELERAGYGAPRVDPNAEHRQQRAELLDVQVAA